MTIQRDSVLILAVACGILLVNRLIRPSYPEEKIVLILVALMVPLVGAGIALQLLTVAPYQKLATELRATDIRIDPKKLRQLYKSKSNRREKSVSL